MKRRFTSSALIGLALQLLWITLPQSRAQFEPILSSHYTIVDEVMESGPDKTTAALRIIVSGTLTQSSLTRLLRRARSHIEERVQIQTHTSLSDIVIWAYISKIHLHSKELWLASLEQKEQASLQIRFNNAHLKELHAPSAPLFGLSEETRKQVWQELQTIQRKSQLEAQALFPLDPSTLSQTGQFFRLSKQSTLLLAEAGATDPPAEMTGAVSLPPQTTISLRQPSLPFQNRLWHYVEVSLPLGENPIEGWIDSLALIRQVQTPNQEYFDQIHTLTESIKFGYQFELVEKHSLSPQQLDEIFLEGILKNWPLPQEINHDNIQ